MTSSAGFTTTTEVLFTSLKALSDRLRLPESECKDLVQAIVTERKKKWFTNNESKTVAQKLRELSTESADNVAALQEPPSLLFGDEGWQNLLGGGLVPGTLTEVSGEA